MGKEEKRRKFHEALLHMLYPPPPPTHHEENVDERRLNSNSNCLAVNRISGELGETGCSASSSSSSEDDEIDCGTQKLSRAQRKRLRKKKLREDGFRRGGIIGPLLPVPDNEIGVEAERVRQNVNENGLGEPTPCTTNQSKVKLRRRAKKLARENTDSVSTEMSHQDCDPPSSIKQ